MLLVSAFFIFFIKILSLCAKAYLEPSQTFKGLIVWRFLALAENFDSVKRVGKKMTGKHLCQSLFFNKGALLRLAQNTIIFKLLKYNKIKHTFVEKCSSAKRAHCYYQWII